MTETKLYLTWDDSYMKSYLRHPNSTHGLTNRTSDLSANHDDPAPAEPTIIHYEEDDFAEDDFDVEDDSHDASAIVSEIADDEYHDYYAEVNTGLNLEDDDYDAAVNALEPPTTAHLEGADEYHDYYAEANTGLNFENDDHDAAVNALEPPTTAHLKGADEYPDQEVADDSSEDFSPSSPVLHGGPANMFTVAGPYYEEYDDEYDDAYDGRYSFFVLLRVILMFTFGN